MGFFGPSKREELAAKLDAQAKEAVRDAKKYRAKAARARDEERTCMFKDPEASNAIARRYDASARLRQEDARDMRKSAAELRKPWWRP